MREIILNSYSISNVDGFLTQIPFSEFCHCNGVGSFEITLELTFFDENFKSERTVINIDLCDYVLTDNGRTGTKFIKKIKDEKNKRIGVCIIKPNDDVSNVCFYDAFYVLDEDIENLIENGYELYPIMLSGIYGNIISENKTSFPPTTHVIFEYDYCEKIITGVKTVNDKMFQQFNNKVYAISDETILSKINSGEIEKLEDFVGNYYISNDGNINVIKDKDSSLYFNVKKMIGELRKQQLETTNYSINKRIFNEFENVKLVQRDIKRKKKKIEKIKKDIDVLLSEWEHRNKNIIENSIKEYHNMPIKYYSSICLLIRDENEYLIEWLDNHLKIGIDHFYIYDNESKVPISDFLKNTKYYDKCTIIRMEGKFKHLQHQCYDDCLTKFGYESRWIGFIDTDELIEFADSNMKINDLLKQYENNYCVWFPWKVYNANGLVNKSDELQSDRFTKTTFEPTGLLGKIFVQPFMIYRMYVHFCMSRFEHIKPITSFGIIFGGEEYDIIKNQYGKYIEHPDLYSAGYIKHYITRSYEEWCNKMKRGSSDPKYRKKFYNFFQYNPDMEYLLNEDTMVIDQGYEA